MKVQPAAFLRTTLPLDLSKLGVARQRPLSLDLAAGSHGELLARLDLDAGVHRPRDRFRLSPSASGCDGGRRGGRRAHQERADRHQRGGYRAQASLVAGTDRADHPSFVAGTLHPGPRLRRDREHGALRLRFRKAGRSLRGGASGHQYALGKRRPGRFLRVSSTSCAMRAWIPSPTRAAIRRSGGRAAARACSASSVDIATAGGRPEPIRPKTMRRSSKSCAMPPSRPAAIPMAITPAMIWTCLIADDDAELAKILEAPLIRAY